MCGLTLPLDVSKLKPGMEDVSVHPQLKTCADRECISKMPYLLEFSLHILRSHSVWCTFVSDYTLPFHFLDTTFLHVVKFHIG